jgi:hypothetical protein
MLNNNNSLVSRILSPLQLQPSVFFHVRASRHFCAWNLQALALEWQNIFQERKTQNASRAGDAVALRSHARRVDGNWRWATCLFLSLARTHPNWGTAALCSLCDVSIWSSHLVHVTSKMKKMRATFNFNQRRMEWKNLMWHCKSFSLSEYNLRKLRLRLEVKLNRRVYVQQSRPRRRDRASSSANYIPFIRAQLPPVWRRGRVCYN